MKRTLLFISLYILFADDTVMLTEPETKAIVEWTKQNRFTFSVSLWSDQRASSFPFSSMPYLHDGMYASLLFIEFSTGDDLSVYFHRR